jgi:nitrite reductase/ring-hydroxylating ferredoxin subunit/uncharacterized membrane protein
MRTSQPLDRIVDRIASAHQLDGVADAVSGVLRKVIRPGPVEDLLTGVPAGHPMHPALVAVPLGAWVSSSALDLLGQGDGARTLTALGCVTALPAAVSGATDWLSTSGGARRVGLVHAALNYSALAVYGLSWRARHRGRRMRGVALSGAGAGLIAASGWLGAHLVYAQGVGVDTTVFEQLPEEWTDAGAEGDLAGDGGAARLEAAGVALLVTRQGDRLIAMADRCTHRGGPLHEGELADGCVTCPWHGSTFALQDGSVRSGPAVRPQPTLEARIRDGRVEVRRPSA